MSGSNSLVPRFRLVSVVVEPFDAFPVAVVSFALPDAFAGWREAVGEAVVIVDEENAAVLLVIPVTVAPVGIVTSVGPDVDVAVPASALEFPQGAAGSAERDARWRQTSPGVGLWKFAWSCR